MKRLFKYLQGVVQAEELRLAMQPLPKSLCSVAERTSDSMVIVYSNESIAAYFFFGSSAAGDSFVFGTAEYINGTWQFVPKDAVVTPFSATDSASECLAIFIELVTAVSMRGYLDISEEPDEIEYFESLLEEKFGISDELSYREITINIIKMMGERIPALSFGARFIY